MPLKRLLDGSPNFDPDTIFVLAKAYEGVVAELGLRAPADQEKAARRVISLALGQTVLDAVKLRDAVANSMLNEDAERRFRGADRRAPPAAE
jgi:hypothetical protein